MDFLPTPDSAVLWFLQNVVGIPSAVLIPIWFLHSLVSWISFGRSAASWLNTGTGGVGSTASLVVVQILLVPMTYITVQMFQITRGRGPWAGFKLDDQFDIGGMLSAALHYDHWTPLTLDVVKWTVGFIILVNVASLIHSDLARICAVVALPAIGVAAIVALAGLAVIGNTLMGDSQSSYNLVPYYIFWVVVLLLWSGLIAITCLIPADIMDRVRGNIR